MTSRRIAAIAIAALPLLAVAATPAMATPVRTLAPLVTPPGDLVEGRYIVTLDEAGLLGDVLARVDGVTPVRRFDRVLDGFVARLSHSQVQRLRTLPSVERIERDSGIRAAVTWNLDRLNQSGLPLNGIYATDATGAGVTAYVIDTGIDPSHPGIDARAANVYDATGGDGRDCNGHGTHVAGIIGGSTYGVAKRVQLRGVRVLDCGGNGTVSELIAGLDWVAAHAEEPAVANVSVGGARSTSLNKAATNLVRSGVYLTAAAGNAGANACEDSPASASKVLTVAAADKSDHVPGWSNHGRCVDIYAPGVNITSAWLAGEKGDRHAGQQGATKTLDGTSMAAPHAAGIVALYLQAGGDASATTITRWIRRHAVHGTLAGVPQKTPNLLLNSAGL